MGSRKRNICIKKLYLDQLHREFLLIFNNKSLPSNQICQFYAKHFLEQSPERLFQISADRRDAYWKEGAY